MVEESVVDFVVTPMILFKDPIQSFGPNTREKIFFRLFENPQRLSTQRILCFPFLSDDFERDKQRQQNNFDLEYSDEYEIVVPRKVKSDGTFVSHQIPHHFKRSFYEKNVRENRAMSEDDAVHYRLLLGQKEHHLELYPSHRFCSPGAIIEEHRTGNGDDKKRFLDDLRIRRMRDRQCHYQGRVRNHPDISALSTCYGLVGYIKTKDSWYTIEPIEGYDFTKEIEHPHIVYRKNPKDIKINQASSCINLDNFNRTIKKREYKEVVRKRRLDNDSQQHKGPMKYTVELLVVLDITLLRQHRDFDVENYVLTMFNMAASLFHDISLGFDMDLAIVRIIRLEVEEKEMNLGIMKNLETTLKRFEEWQKDMNPGDDDHPNHHDLAILLTRVDFCVTRELCGFTGASTMASTCDPLKGAVIVKDSGLITGFHIAHHIGHTLGMSHDVGGENGCPGIVHHQDGFVETSVMYPGSAYVTKKWSNCSRNYLQHYIQSGLAHCLEDEPKDHHFPTMEMLPGVIYNSDFQCRLMYRRDVVHCDLDINCETLSCSIPGKGCVSGRKPPAEGTACAEKRWCYNMKCVMIGERLGAIDGGWSSWSSWSRCSRSCGSGPCEIDAPSFRDVQCNEFNDWVFPEDGKVHRWIAYNLPENLKASENPCSLYCLSDTGLVTSLRPKVVDGTTCYRGIRDICVSGVCREIPCDLDMESNAVEDVCGVCRGDSTSCKIKEGTLVIQAQSTNTNLSIMSEPRKIVDVPAGSRNIRVELTHPTKSRIIVEAKSSGSTLIDGNHLGMYEVAGSKAWLGMIRPRQGALNVPGPVTEDLVILVNIMRMQSPNYSAQCSAVHPVENVTLKYSLGLKQEKPRKGKFSWDFVDWEPCTAVCGPGEQVSKARCIEEIGGMVDENNCKNLTKPDVKVRPCNQAPCLPRWMLGDWQGCENCTAKCKRTRAVKCIRPVGHGEQDVDIIPDNYCQGPKPKESILCSSDINRINRMIEDISIDEDRSSVNNETTVNFEDIKKGELVIDKEYIDNLTLTIIIERDENNNVVNLPKDLASRTSENDTELLLVGMDAVKYIQTIQEEEVKTTFPFF
ncbi:hypothetical protein HZH66_013870 [Vespula vulgaris]|uniref:Peptidase M12B domain-containing protein n=1 Tax=Vespula vulgaris TaxID=7454 RepID=A0A834J5F0_VESVU|nr:hypothetical protein HZH66_013870 [Vespula vulgaris]